jgi:hypothetical protein
METGDSVFIIYANDDHDLLPTTSHFLHHLTEIQTQCTPSNMERGDKSHQNPPEYNSLCSTIDL